MAASLAGVIACSEPTAPVVAAPEAATPVDAQSAMEVQVVLDDVPVRLPGAIPGHAARSRFHAALAAVRHRVEVGRLDEATAVMSDVRAALAAAAELDASGEGDADRTAILLALDATSTRISNARRRAAGGLR
jgi:hypothetical protein